MNENLHGYITEFIAPQNKKILAILNSDPEILNRDACMYLITLSELIQMTAII